jgi:hypothetical protein
MMTGSDSPVATYMVTPSNLDKMSAFLLRGERRKAVKYALDHQMWAHAFVISSCVDTDCWKDVVTEFLRSELSPPLDGGSAASNGREGLRVAYSMFAGLGGADSSTSRISAPSSWTSADDVVLHSPPVPATSSSRRSSFDPSSTSPLRGPPVSCRHAHLSQLPRDVARWQPPRVGAL